MKKDNKKKGIKPADLVYLGAIALMLVLALGHGKNTTTEYEPALGDEVVFGTYLGEPIEWRVLKINEDNLGRKTTVVLVSDKILMMKAFDAPESGTYSEDGNGGVWRIGDEKTLENLEMQEYTHGTSDWSKSDIRTWLNSNQQNVIYNGKGPISAAMAEAGNGYIFEPGFLCGFSSREQEAIVPTHNITQGNALSDGDVETSDLVYLLSRDELDWFYDANINILAVPAEQAIEHDDTNSYQIFSVEWGLEAYLWWLRDPVEGYSCQVYVVGNGYKDKLLLEYAAGIGCGGIRPAVTVDIKKLEKLMNEYSSE